MLTKLNTYIVSMSLPERSILSLSFLS
jgi:hypothetical protein